MKLLILTQYFPPEVGAPQNRLFELAVRLQHAGVEVTVLTAMPNYPQMEIHPAYRGKKYCYETIEGLRVHRTAIYVSKQKSVVARLRNYFSFVVSSARAAGKLEPGYDFLMCESPPLFLGYSALYLARKKNARLIFNVSDMWPESAEKLGVVKNKTMLNMAYRLEERLYKAAALVTGQTQGICANINRRFPEVATYWLPNGVDLGYYDPLLVNPGNWRQQHGFAPGDFILLYAGIIGLAQGLEVILEAADQLRDKPRLKFVLMGSGPEKDKLIAIRSSRQLSNVMFLDPVTKQQMPAILKSVNAAVVPLKKLELFQGAIPSKIFESLAMEIPLLLGVDGEARDLFINTGKCGLYFEPGNPASLAAAVSTIISSPQLAGDLGRNGRKYVTANFNRKVIAENFHEQLTRLNKRSK